MGPVWDFDLSAGSRCVGVVPPVGWTPGKRDMDRPDVPRPSLLGPGRSAVGQAEADRGPGCRPDPGCGRAAPGHRRGRLAVVAHGDGGRPGSRDADSFSGEVGFLRDWSTNGQRGCPARRRSSAEAPVTVPERSRTVWIPVRLTRRGRVHSRGLPVARWDGYRTSTSSCRTDGRTSSGQTERFIPVTIAADTETRAPRPSESAARSERRGRVGSRTRRQ